MGIGWWDDPGGVIRRHKYTRYVGSETNTQLWICL